MGLLTSRGRAETYQQWRARMDAQRADHLAQYHRDTEAAKATAIVPVNGSVSAAIKARIKARQAEGERW